MLETEPRTLLLEDDEIVFANGRSSLATGVEGFVIAVETRLRLIRGEWVYDRSVGVPWFENEDVPAARAIIGQRFDLLKLRTAVRSAIEGTPSFAEMLSLVVTFDAETRTASITWQARIAFDDSTATTDVVTTEITTL